MRRKLPLQHIKRKTFQQWLTGEVSLRMSGRAIHGSDGSVHSLQQNTLLLGVISHHKMKFSANKICAGDELG